MLTYKTFHRPMTFGAFGPLVRYTRLMHSRLMRTYADWRVGATIAEKYLYRSSPNIVLTFDDYGSAEQVESILEILAAENIRSIFFLQGDWVKANAQLLQRIKDRGHVIGNHTYSHANLMRLSDEEVRSEIANGPKSTLMRPPGGRYDERIRQISASLGQNIAYWTIDSDDWKGVTAEYMRQKILDQLHPGAVILFHLHADNTIQLLPELISEIRGLDYEFMNVDEDPMDGPNV